MDIKKWVTLPDGTKVPALGQGTWFMGESPTKLKQELDALRLGIDQGLTLIDTAEMYADGGAEKVVGKAIDGLRSKVFLVSKVLPSNASYKGVINACENSLKRLRTDYLDLYLLHWRGSFPLSETIKGMEVLIQQGKIKRWGVSNFDVDDLKVVEESINQHNLTTNQVLYNLGRRGIEFDLLPWCREKSLPTMAYAPIERGKLFNNQQLIQLAHKHQATPSQIALAWVIRCGDIIAIPKASSTEHIMENIKSLNIQLTDEDLATLDKAFPPPKHKVPLEIL